MADPTSTQPIVIVKKKAAHGGHHGGAWKVAYADFVTAMMALFIVLWLMNSSREIQEAVGGYFRDPSGQSGQIGSGSGGAGEGIIAGKDEMSKLKDDITTAMNNLRFSEQLKENVQMTVGGEGLRVELLETEKGMFFESGKALPSSDGEELLVLLAKQLGELDNDVLLEGHTDSKPFSNPDYSNWELSTDRANAARRLMESSGLRPGQVIQVRGFADRNLLNPKDPLDPANRRISVIVQPRAAAPEQGAATPGRGSTSPPQHP